MKNLTLIVLVLAVYCLACASGSNSTSQSSPSANTSSSLANTSSKTTNSAERTFDLDLAGQVGRIMYEGFGDEAVKKNIAEVDKTITYEQLKKNANKYAGKPWAFTGKILEITENADGTIARVSLDDWGNKAIYVAGPITTDLVEKNRAYVVGYLAGNYSYTSQANWQITVPALAARSMTAPGGKKK